MHHEKIFKLKRTVDGFRTALCDALLKENNNVKQISAMLYDTVNQLAIASEFVVLINMCSNDADIEEFKYKFAWAICDAFETIECIQATMRTNQMCDKTKMALTGACLLIKCELETLHYCVSDEKIGDTYGK